MNRRQFLAFASVAATATQARSQAGAEEPPMLSFGLICDVQYVDADPQGERHYRESLPKLTAAVAALSMTSRPVEVWRSHRLNVTWSRRAHSARV